MTGRDEDGGFTQHIPSNILATARACVHRVVRRLPGFPGRGAARGHPPATPGAGYAGRTTMEGGTIMIRRYRVSNGNAAGGSGGNGREEGREDGRDDGRKASRAVGRAVAAAMVALLIVSAVLAGSWLWSRRDGIISGVKAFGVKASSMYSHAREPDTTVTPPDVSRRRYPVLTSPVDFNGNGVDDYTDIMRGARKDALAHPAYDDGYYQGGYPPADRGACVDVVWRAFRNAGYDLKAMVDADIAADRASYASVVAKPDPNIDFRRTGVLDVFFGKYGITLTNDVNDHAQWQQGDIVVFDRVKHIGVISDKRDADGFSYVLHNMNQRRRENDYLAFSRRMGVTGHYRWDASRVPKSVLRAWKG
ncbi:DUF1287 domain-containing protein [Bifidobacteriaceae bacterium MCC01946]|nr:DUF1287 domain-containing protein [Bifidobacteriaceae bacterium MCC01946]GDZ12611.1 DUF1287 domain-containing protein [Bifidobacteriaceae bacterium MCC02030]